MPLQGNHVQGARMRAQWDAGAPLMKQLWKTIVVAKIKMQAAALAAYGGSHEPLLFLARQVKSNDEGNLEAQAARRYWPEMMGKEFRRDAGLPGANALLNYGYTVMRATAARAVVASGLTPTIGLFHANRGNAFALADDIMEPFRPLVDCAVRGMISAGVSDVTTDAKRCLARLTALDLNMGDVQSPVSMALTRLAQSLAQRFLTAKNCLELPLVPSPMELAALGKDVT